MIKKSVFEKELIAGMHKELIKNATSHDLDNVEQAVDYLNSAIDIFEDAGMQTQADQVTNILFKIAASDENDVKKSKSDKHTKGLTPDKMLNNLKNHGTVFNMANDGMAAHDLMSLDNADADDLLNIDISDNALEVSEKDLHHGIEDFEDERD